MTRRPATDAELNQLEARLDAWLADWARSQSAAGPDERPLLLDVTRDADVPRRWYLRLSGESRDVIAIWLTLRQRTLAYESYVLPAPQHRPNSVADFVLRRNHSLVGARYGIGPEDALYLTGELPTHCVDEDELDRIVGSLWSYVERDFTTLIRLGFRQ
ncbi:YbjN domain-containing protein [Candidatus Poriferisodalis sp.]|uniref:YbjN domain-containing protein n=1 Tax=Candidatus Poriferisodalis sp. TaxID=3101277 RepID=UPI003B0219BF